MMQACGVVEPHPAARMIGSLAHRSATGPLAVTGFDLEQALERCGPMRRSIRKGDRIHRSGDRCDSIHYVHCGFVKSELSSADGRAVLTGVHLRGDLLGCEGLSSGRHLCDSVALDAGEVWEIPFQRLLQAGASHPGIHHAVYAAMSEAMCRDRERLLSLNSLTAEQRVAWFLLDLAARLQRRGYSADRVDMRMTRSEIGSYLGLKLETVSRSLTRLAALGLIRVSAKSVEILRAEALRLLGQGAGASA